MDKNTIPALLAGLYARNCDMRTYAKMHDILWPEFSMKADAFSADSADTYIAMLPALDDYARTFHNVGTQFGEWQGDTYEGETYCVASHFSTHDGGETNLEMTIRYPEVIDIRDGVAKYLKRDFILVNVELKPVLSPPQQ